MADSKNLNDSSTDDFADDLEAMLNEVESSSDEELELIDDEDAIDRLLMDDVFETVEEDSSEQVEDESEMKAESEDTAELVEDEFADENDAEILSDDVIDEFADEDDFENLEVQEEVAEEPEQEQISESLEEVDEFSADEFGEEDEFLLADFDISTDDGPEDEDKESEDSLEDEMVEDEFSPEVDTTSALNDPADQLQADTDIPQTEMQQEQTADNPGVSLDDFEQLTAQINQLWSDNEALKQQISGIAIPDDMNDTFSEDIEGLRKDHNKLKKSLKENEGKVPVLSYVALAIAIIALLVGTGLGIVGFGAESSVTDLEQVVLTLEEEIEVLIANDSSAEIKKLNEKVLLLKEENSKLHDQYSTLNTAIKSNTLKPVVDDLVVQNDHAQVAIEQLLARMDVVEKHKPAKNIPRKAKKIVPKPDWVVNLVSFKQDWYAKRKAAEFEKKGVPAEVIKANVNGEKWFRLRVKGFKSKYAAAAYAVKVKKTLNLSSVWVTKK